MNSIKVNIEIKEQHNIIAKNDQEFDSEVAKIKESLQPDEQIVVAKMVVAKVIIIKTKTS